MTKIIVKVTNMDSGNNSRFWSAPVYEIEQENIKTIGDLLDEIYKKDIKINNENSVLSSARDITLIYFGMKLKSEQSIDVIRDAIEYDEPVMAVFPKAKKQLENSKSVNDFFDDKKFIDLNGVGICKSLGYLGIETIKKAGFNVEDLISEFKQKGLSLFITDDQILYVYDTPSCQKHLSLNSDKLNGWPEDAEQFILKVSQETARIPELHKIINELFEDPDIVISEDRKLNLF